MKLLELATLLKPNYCPDWFHRVLAEHLESDRDVLISTPPGAGKTELVSILFPTHVLCHDTKKHVISLSNSDSLARLASSNILRNLRSPQVQERWPMQFDKESEVQFTITGGDGRPSVHSCGINGQVTGQRADLLIFDDPIKNQTEAYSETVREKVWSNFLSCAETRLLPDGRIVGIGTRWHLDDPIGRLLKRALEDRYARQFVYISLAAWNHGEESFVLDTRTHKKKFFPPYRSLASKIGQPYSFSRRQLLGKKADLGPSRWAALYMQSPVAGDDQLFPPDCWRTYEKPLDIDDIQVIVTAWDCASKTGSRNDFSANVTACRMADGRYRVLDVWKSKVSFAELPQLAFERYRQLYQQYGQLPILTIEDANAGTQLLQLFQARYPDLPTLPAKPVHAKIIRAEGVTPYTRGGLVSLPKEAEWKDAFVREMANFPVGEHDDVVDAFCHAMKAFVTQREFRTANFLHSGLSPRQLEELEVQQLVDEAMSERSSCIDSDLDAFDRNFGRGEW